MNVFVHKYDTFQAGNTHSVIYYCFVRVLKLVNEAC